MQAVILAAGKGKRLHPITTNRTKAMAPIAGKPIIERVMEALVSNGIRSFIIVASPEDLEIQDYFSNLSTIPADVTIIYQPKALGMGNALQVASPFIRQDFVVSACDNLVKPEEINQLLQVWNREKMDALLTTIKVGAQDVNRMGIVELKNNRIIRIIEKPPPENAPSNVGSVPLYVFTGDILKDLSKMKLSPRGEYELQDAIQMLIERGGDVYAFPLSGRKDLTKPEDLLELNLLYLSKLHQQGIGGENARKNSLLIPPYYIEENVNIGSNCRIGPRVFIEHGCDIGNHVHLRDAVVLRNRSISSNTIGENLILW